jgi:hypothetical protein
LRKGRQHWGYIVVGAWGTGTTTLFTMPSNNITQMDLPFPSTFVGLALVGKDIVFRLVIEYSSLKDFDP